MKRKIIFPLLILVIMSAACSALPGSSPDAAPDFIREFE